MPLVPPVAVAPLPTGTTHLFADVLSIEHGKPVRLPTPIDYHSDRPWGSEYDRGLEEIDEAIRDALDAWPIADKSSVIKRAELLGRFQSALHAVRYHQKQFMARHNLVNTARPGPWLRNYYDDGPLKIELEAYILRWGALRDAMAKLFAEVLGWKGRPSFGKFRDLLNRQDELTRHEIALRRAFIEHEDALQKLKDIRDAIAHEGKADRIKYDSLRSDPIRPAMIEDDQLAVMDAWRSMRGVLLSLASALGTR